MDKKIKRAEKILAHIGDLERSVRFMSKKVEKLKCVGGKQREINLLRKRINETMEVIDDVEDILDGIEQESEEGKLYADLLRAWYIEKKRREDIEDEFGYNIGHLYKLRRKALKKFVVNIMGIDGLD